MPCWYFDKKELRNTPSIADGIDYETECRYRKEGARFIIATGTKMDLGCSTMATGVVYFHRFYMFHSFRTFPRYVMACCCLFLAGKVEETPKKCKDIIKIARASLSEQKLGTFGDDPKEEVMTLERILLQTIKFDLQVEHPYSFVVRYAKCLKGDKAKLQKMVQMAWTFVNDSLCTTLCLQWEPEVIAVALMYLAGKLSQFEVVDWNGRMPKHLRWWDMYVQDVTMDLLEDICHQVLDLYSQPVTNEVLDSPPLPPRPVSVMNVPVHDANRSPMKIAKIGIGSVGVVTKNGQDPDDIISSAIPVVGKQPSSQQPIPTVQQVVVAAATVHEAPPPPVVTVTPTTLPVPAVTVPATVVGAASTYPPPPYQNYPPPAPMAPYPATFSAAIQTAVGHMGAPPPPINAPPPVPGAPPPSSVYGPSAYVTPPPHYASVVAAHPPPPGFYQPPPGIQQPPPHRPYYPPPT